MEEAQKLSDDLVMEILFDSSHIFADIFWCFERVMALGVKYLYQVTKDIATLRAEISSKEDHPANSQMIKGTTMSTKEQDLIMREKLEAAYEEEKLRSALIQRCYRIYHDFLQAKDEELYNHLINNQVNPELHLMRWLRCMLSREFDVKICIDYWDYIITGVFTQGPSSREPFPP